MVFNIMGTQCQVTAPTLGKHVPGKSNLSKGQTFARGMIARDVKIIQGDGQRNNNWSRVIHESLTIHQREESITSSLIQNAFPRTCKQVWTVPGVSFVRNRGEFRGRRGTVS